MFQSGDKVVMKLDSLKSRIDVESGDLPGIFIKGKNVTIKFLTNLNIATYVYATDMHLQFLKTDYAHYRSVAPLIRTGLKIQGKE